MGTGSELMKNITKLFLTLFLIINIFWKSITKHISLQHFLKINNQKYSLATFSLTKSNSLQHFLSPKMIPCNLLISPKICPYNNGARTKIGTHGTDRVKAISMLTRCHRNIQNVVIIRNRARRLNENLRKNPMTYRCPGVIVTRGMRVTYAEVQLGNRDVAGEIESYI